MPEAMQTAYRSSTPEIQQKLRRVFEVWRTRNVFETPILEAIEGRIEEVDRSKGSSGKKTLMGNSLFNSSSSTGMPKELETLAPLQIAVTKATLAARPPTDTAETEYKKLHDASAPLPSPPVHAARLSSLIKVLAAAESSLSASIKARQALIADLERIVEINKAALAKDEEAFREIESRKISSEAKKREVEDGIMRGLTSVGDSPTNVHGGTPELDVGDVGRTGNATGFERPEVEELTPEPEGTPTDVMGGGGVFGSDRPSNPAVAAVLAGFGDTRISVTGGRVRPASGGQGTNGLSAKRRKMSHDDGDLVPDLGEMGMEHLGNGGNDTALHDLDEDVDELLRQESAKV